MKIILLQRNSLLVSHGLQYAVVHEDTDEVVAAFCSQEQAVFFVDCLSLGRRLICLSEAVDACTPQIVGINARDKTK